MQSTTPAGTPPQDFIPLNEQSSNAAPTTDTSAILANLQALADLAKKNSAAPTGMGGSNQASSNNVTFPQNTFPQNMSSSVNQAPSVPPPAQAVNIPGAANGVFPYPALNNAAQALLQNQPNGQQNMQNMPAAPPPMNQGNVPVTPEILQQQLQILQVLKAQGVPQEQWANLLQVLMSSGTGIAPNTNAASQPNYGGYGGRDDLSRDRNGYDQYMRSPPNRYRNPRSRSRSPLGWDRRREPTPPRRRDSPVYGDYGNDRNGRGDFNRHGGRGRGGQDKEYRQRSPTRFRRSPSPQRQDHILPPPGPKWIEYDHSIGEGMIKGELSKWSTTLTSAMLMITPVLSRTLFVGGVT